MSPTKFAARPSPACDSWHPPTAPLCFLAAMLAASLGVACAAQTEPTFPGTGIRFYPGFYFSTEGHSPKAVNQEWVRHVEPNKTRWRTKGTYLGIFFNLPWNEFYRDTRVRPKDPTNPDDPAYDWSAIDDVLNGCPFLNNGEGKLAFRIDDRRGKDNPPLWFREPPHNGVYLASGKNGMGKQVNYWITAYHRKSAVNEYAAFLTAVGKRYNADKRIAFIALEETVQFKSLPPDWKAPRGGGTGGFSQMPAWTEGVAQRDIALKTAAPHLTVIDYGLHSSHIPRTLPHKVGAGCPDPYMFSGSAGRKGYPAVDCNEKQRHWVAQKHRDLIPTLMSSELGGWRVLSDSWPTITTPWGKPGTSGVDPAKFLWYHGGPPKATAPLNDSKLGQAGPDPGGPIPVSMIVILIRRDSSNRTYENWKIALDTFGPSGTFACPYFPAGYPHGR